MTKLYFCTAFIFLTFGACNANQDSVLVNKSDLASNKTSLTNYELYDLYTKEIQAAYWSEDYDQVVRLIEKGFNLTHEGTTHDNYVFNAVKFWQVGEIDNAKKVLRDFLLMLKIDEGLVECDVINMSLKSKDNKEIKNELVYDEMCWEMQMSFYGQSNENLNVHRNELRRIVEDIQQKLSSK